MIGSKEYCKMAKSAILKNALLVAYTKILNQIDQLQKYLMMKSTKRIWVSKFTIFAKKIVKTQCNEEKICFNLCGLLLRDQGQDPQKHLAVHTGEKSTGRVCSYCHY